MDLTNIKKDNNFLINYGVFFSFGLVFLVFWTFCIRLFLHVSFAYLAIIPFLSILYILKKPRVLRGLFITGISWQSSLLILFVIILGVITQTIVITNGGVLGDNGLIVPSLNDSMWNISLVAELFNHTPNQNPIRAGEVLKNYHYFYHLFLAAVHYFTNLSFFDLYYRFGPWFISFLFGINLYLVSSLFTRRTIFRGLAIFLGYFSGNFAYLLPIFLGRQFDWKGNSFYSDQPFDQIINTHSIVGYCLFLISIYIISKIAETKAGDRRGWIIIGSFVFGTFYGFKTFGGIIAVGGIISTALLCLFFLRDRAYLSLIIGTLIILAPVYFMLTEPTQARLHPAPGWILTEMVSGNTQLNLPYYANVENYYHGIGNWLGYMKIKFIELAIYFFGNLGTRLLGVIFLIGILLKDIKKKSNMFPVIIYVVFSTSTALMIPLLFNLGGNAYNVVQFTPYALLILGVLTVMFLERIYYLFQGKYIKLLGGLIVIVVIALSIPVNVKNILGKLQTSGDRVSLDEFSALSYLKDHALSEGVILVDARQYVNDPVYISALSERRVYFASNGLAIPTINISGERRKNVVDFFENKLDINRFLSENNISYLYLRGPINENILSTILKRKDSRLFYLNNSVYIYKVGHEVTI
ncbi:MAG: hypothetical protein WCT77_01510 [Bacteroidota bacterium]